MGSSLGYGPHSRFMKTGAKFQAEECRHGRQRIDMCAWHWMHGAGCPWLNYGVPCNAVQEGHWTLIFMNCHCRDMRRYNERRKG